MADTPQKSMLVVSDESSPPVAVKPGMRLKVHAITLVDSELKETQAVGARLCGGTTTCLALIEI